MPEKIILDMAETENSLKSDWTNVNMDTQVDLPGGADFIDVTDLLRQAASGTS
jgi:hypothetical protein